MTVRFHGVFGSDRSPGEGVVDDDALRNATGAVVGIGLEVFPGGADLVREDGVAPPDGTGDRFRVRVDEQLRGIEAMPLLGVVRSVNAVAVVLAGAHVRQVAMPHLVRSFANRNRPALGRVGLVIEETGAT
jgi:hypothetical protein